MDSLRVQLQNFSSTEFQPHEFQRPHSFRSALIKALWFRFETWFVVLVFLRAIIPVRGPLTIADSSLYQYGTGQSALLTFLREISFVSDQKSEMVMGEDGKNFVKLMTLHAAKGLEFDCVFITGLQEDLLPLSGQNMSEERRLFYVGVTRAMQRLYITFSSSNIIEGEKIEAEPSRFLNDIVNSEMKHILE